MECEDEITEISTWYNFWSGIDNVSERIGKVIFVNARHTSFNTYWGEIDFSIYYEHF